jgi:acyl dehydratase
LSQNFRFEKPVYVGDKIIATVELKNGRKDKGIFTFITTCHNDITKEVVISGEAMVYHPNCTME